MSTLTQPLPAASSTPRIGVKKLLAAGGSTNGLVANALYVGAAAFIAVSAFIHLHLWMNGYRQIPTIGPLFMAQVVTGFVMAALVLITRRFVAAFIAFGFVASTLGGFILSIRIGLFGFKDSFSAPFAHEALLVEILALVFLAGACALSIRQAARA